MKDILDSTKIPLEEQTQRLLNVAIKDPEHLKRWLQETNRRWMMFDTLDLVDALPFPDGLEALIQIIACYRDHRRTKFSGNIEMQINPLNGKEVAVQLMKSENLEVDELDRAIRFLIGLITEKEPTWKLENPPM